MHGKRLVYLDTASSSQKPLAVIEAMPRYYETTHANVHRGVYEIAQEATRLYEEARAKVATFIGASSPDEVVFTKNATEAINLVAYSWGRNNIGPGDVVVTSEIEHHANFVPWLQLREEKGAELRFLRLGDDGALDLDNLDQLLDGAKLLAVTAASNVLGTLPRCARWWTPLTPPARSCSWTAPSMSPTCRPTYGTSGPTSSPSPGTRCWGQPGIGALWARRELLEAMPAFLTGGEMIRDVRLDGFTTNDIPWKFEAGTPPIAEAIGLGVAIDYLRGMGMGAVRSHEQALTSYAMTALKERYGDDIVIYGPPPPRRGRGSSASRTRTSTPTTCPRCSTRSGSACAPATTAPNR